MPEGLEAEIWRGACEPLVGRTIVGADVDERVAPAGFESAIVGSSITGVRRLGKVVLLDVCRMGEASHAIGLHFGMTGRLVVDGVAAIERLTYASGRDAAAWDRCVLLTDPSPAGVGTPGLRFNDPRRLGRITIDPDLSRIGVDIFDVTAPALGAALARRHIELKTALLDQHVIAGLGNLLVDEVLWWSGLNPRRAAATLDQREVRGLAAVIRRRLPIMLRRGGSTTGNLSPDVRSAPHLCERDGLPLRRESIGARTTIWCPGHQH